MAGCISSALLLLLNMAGALLSPRAPPALPAADDEGGVVFFFFPFLVLYKSGRVERFMGTDTVPASVDPATGVASKDVAIDAAAGLAVRLYLPNTTAEKLPLVVFYHGGGFVMESAFSPTYQRMRGLAAREEGPRRRRRGRGGREEAAAGAADVTEEDRSGHPGAHLRKQVVGRLLQLARWKRAASTGGGKPTACHTAEQQQSSSKGRGGRGWIRSLTLTRRRAAHGDRAWS